MKAELKAMIKDIKTQWLREQSGQDIEWDITPIDIELFKAGMREAGLQLRARMGGVDEFIDWSNEGLREFRKMTIRTIKEILEEWGIKDNG